jgi:hypothetical protein
MEMGDASGLTKKCDRYQCPMHLAYPYPILKIKTTTSTTVEI